MGESIKDNLFSVAMCVYGGDKPEWFDTAIESILNQTVLPDEVVIVVDGPVPQGIEDVLEKYRGICTEKGVFLNVVRQEKNSGLGISLKIAIENCRNEIIARMDSDDVSVNDRFEQQIRCLCQNPEVDIVGGDIAEFIDEEENIVGYRNVPTDNYEIKEYAKKRCPFNHVTVMYKKGAVLSAGGYLDWFWNEDYYLWLRMQKNNAVFANTGTILVNVRVGKDMYNRRGGIKYFKSEAKLQKYMLDNKIIGKYTYISNVCKRLIVQVLLPNRLRGWVFKKFAREKQ